MHSRIQTASLIAQATVPWSSGVWAQGQFWPPDGDPLSIPSAGWKNCYACIVKDYVRFIFDTRGMRFSGATARWQVSRLPGLSWVCPHFQAHRLAQDLVHIIVLSSGNPSSSSEIGGLKRENRTGPVAFVAPQLTAIHPLALPSSGSRGNFAIKVAIGSATDRSARDLCCRPGCRDGLQ